VPLIVAGAVGALFAASSSAVPSPGKRIAGATSRGQFAVTTAHATISRPKVIYARVFGRSNRSTFIVACTKGVDVSANTTNHKGPGVWKLPIMHGADTCDVTASAAGSGRVALEIRAL
jgi:hypothetical protein